MKVLTTCPFCGSGCGVVLEVEQNRILSAFPQRAHPISRGTLCIKGRQAHKIIHHDKRLSSPAIKRNGSFQSVGWDEAIKFIADRILEIKQNQGADSIGFIGSVKCTNEENYLLNKLVKSGIGTNNIDSAIRYFHAPTVNALQPYLHFSGSTCSLLDIEKAETILILGANTKDQSARIGSYILQAAKKGTQCILVDPRPQDHSRFYTHNLQIKPGRDFWLVQSMIHVILDKGWYPKSDKNSSLLAKSVQAFDPETCAEITGVEADDIIKTAELYAKAEGAVILYGAGITQQANGSATVQSVWNLALLADQLFKVGAGILPVMYSNNMQGAMDMGLVPDLLPGYYSVKDSKQRKHFQDLWNAEIAAEPGLTLQEMIENKKDLQALYIVGENVLWSSPNSSKIRETLANLNFMVVQDLFMTETAEMADVILPAASFAEKDGTYTSTDRRVQRVRKAIQPIGESKSDLEIFLMLAKQLGIDYSYTDEQNVFEEMSQNIPIYQGLSFESIDPPGGHEWPAQQHPDEFLKNLVNGSYDDFIKTFKPQELNEHTNKEYPFTLIVGRTPFHRMTGTLFSRILTLDKEYPVGTVELNPDDARELKVRNGWQIAVKSPRGSIVRTVVINNALPAKTIFVPIHHKDGLTQELLSSNLESESKIPQMKFCAAKVENVV